MPQVTRKYLITMMDMFQDAINRLDESSTEIGTASLKSIEISQSSVDQVISSVDSFLDEVEKKVSTVKKAGFLDELRKHTMEEATT